MGRLLLHCGVVVSRNIVGRMLHSQSHADKTLNSSVPLVPVQAPAQAQEERCAPPAQLAACRQRRSQS